MKHNEKIATVVAMKKYGGGFVQVLADALIRADADNLQRLEKAFPEYIARYLLMARVNKEKLGIDYDIGAGE